MSQPFSAENGLFCMDTVLPCPSDTGIRHGNLPCRHFEVPCRATVLSYLTIILRLRLPYVGSAIMARVYTGSVRSLDIYL